MTVATEAVLVVQYVWLLRNHLSVSQWTHALVRPLGATLVMGIVTLLMRAQMPMLLTIALAALSYLVLLFAFGVIGRSEFQFLRQIQHSLHQRMNARPVEL
jgi:hypothetical protein